MIEMSFNEKRRIFVLTVLCFLIGGIIPFVWRGVIAGSVAILVIALGFLGMAILFVHRKKASIKMESQK